MLEPRLQTSDLGCTLGPNGSKILFMHVGGILGSTSNDFMFILRSTLV